MGASPTPADSTHCLRGQNKSSLKTSWKHMPNPQPRLHEVSNCGPWVITLQLCFSTDVRGRLVAGQLSLLAEGTCGCRTKAHLHCSALAFSPRSAPQSLPSFPVLPCSPAVSQASILISLYMAPE